MSGRRQKIAAANLQLATIQPPQSFQAIQYLQYATSDQKVDGDKAWEQGWQLSVLRTQAGYNATCLILYLSVDRVSKVSDRDHNNVHQSSYDVKSTPPSLCNTICDDISKCLSSLRRCIRERGIMMNAWYHYHCQMITVKCYIFSSKYCYTQNCTFVREIKTISKSLSTTHMHYKISK